MDSILFIPLLNYWGRFGNIVDAQKKKKKTIRLSHHLNHHTTTSTKIQWFNPWDNSLVMSPTSKLIPISLCVCGWTSHTNIEILRLRNFCFYSKETQKYSMIQKNQSRHEFHCPRRQIYSISRTWSQSRYKK